MPTPADLFTCPRHPGDLRLTPDACAALWARGRAADALDPVARCQGCPIGAGHARAPLSAAEPRPPLVCVGCGAPCGGTTGRRLVVACGLCVSCYNRERECALGADRRGRPPKRTALVALTLTVNGTVLTHPAGERVTLALWALRQTPGATVSRSLPYGSPWQHSWLPGLGLRGPRPRAVTHA
jgi:hypothetical protein